MNKDKNNTINNKINDDLKELAVEYTNIKEKYEGSREIQRKKIVTYLDNEGFKVKQSGGRGYYKYKNSGFRRLEHEFDLRSYKYINASKVKYSVFISLQPPDKDHKTKNRHTLVDRLGFRVYLKNEPPEDTPKKDFYEIKLTPIDLPITEIKLDLLLKLINNEIDVIENQQG